MFNFSCKFLNDNDIKRLFIRRGTAEGLLKKNEHRIFKGKDEETEMVI